MKTKPEYAVADAMRRVAVRLAAAVEQGHQSRAIDAWTLEETLLAIADELDPAVSPADLAAVLDQANRPAAS